MPIMYSGGAGNINSSQIVDDSIINADINSAAAIVRTKLASSVFTFKSGIAAKNLGDASGVQNIAHGLGRIPSRVSFNWAGRQAVHIFMAGSYDGTNQACTIAWDGGAPGESQSTTYGIILLNDGPGPGTTSQSGVVTFDATNIIITWTKVGAPAGATSFLWEAE